MKMEGENWVGCPRGRRSLPRPGLKELLPELLIGTNGETSIRAKPFRRANSLCSGQPTSPYCLYTCQSNSPFCTSCQYFNTKLGEVQKKVTEDVKASKDEVIKLQASFDNFKLESKNASEVLEGENQKLREEIEGLKMGTRKKLSEAYSTGFLDYLRNFLAADPEYNWSTHFASSTPGYMLQFKSDNVEEIAAAKEELRQKIEAEMKTKADEEARKKEAAGGEDTGTVSPTENAAN